MRIPFNYKLFLNNEEDKTNTEIKQMQSYKFRRFTEFDNIYKSNLFI